MFIIIKKNHLLHVLKFLEYNYVFSFLLLQRVMCRLPVHNERLALINGPCANCHCCTYINHNCTAIKFKFRTCNVTLPLTCSNILCACEACDIQLRVIEMSRSKCVVWCVVQYLVSLRKAIYVWCTRTVLYLAMHVYCNVRCVVYVWCVVYSGWNEL